MASKQRRFVRRSGSYLLLTFLAIIVGFPLYIIFADSLMSIREISSVPPKFFPSHPLWHTYHDAFEVITHIRILPASLQDFRSLEFV